MKLYTEEQVIMAMYLTTLTKETYSQVLEQLTPIELPSDEEIEKFTDTMFYGEKKYFVKTGAFWMKQQILNQNK